MGSASTNFYNHAYSRQGWAEVAAEVRERWQAGDRDGAAGLVTDEMVLATTLIGTEPWCATACVSGVAGSTQIGGERFAHARQQRHGPFNEFVGHAAGGPRDRDGQT